MDINGRLVDFVLRRYYTEGGDCAQRDSAKA
jgi:hypothetical protein